MPGLQSAASTDAAESAITDPSFANSATSGRSKASIASGSRTTNAIETRDCTRRRGRRRAARLAIDEGTDHLQHDGGMALDEAREDRTRDPREIRVAPGLHGRRPWGVEENRLLTHHLAGGDLSDEALAVALGVGKRDADAARDDQVGGIAGVALPKEDLARVERDPLEGVSELLQHGGRHIRKERRQVRDELDPPQSARHDLAQARDHRRNGLQELGDRAGRQNRDGRQLLGTHGCRALAPGQERNLADDAPRRHLGERPLVAVLVDEGGGQAAGQHDEHRVRLAALIDQGRAGGDLDGRRCRG